MTREIESDSGLTERRAGRLNQPMDGTEVMALERAREGDREAFRMLVELVNTEAGDDARERGRRPTAGPRANQS